MRARTLNLNALTRKLIRFYHKILHYGNEQFYQKGYIFFINGVGEIDIIYFSTIFVMRAAQILVIIIECNL